MMRNWEFSDWLFLGLIIGFAVLSIVSIIVVFSSIGDPDAQAKFKFNESNRIVEQCLLSEQYTRQECIILASGQK